MLLHGASSSSASGSMDAADYAAAERAGFEQFLDYEQRHGTISTIARHSSHSESDVCRRNFGIYSFVDSESELV